MGQDTIAMQAVEPDRVAIAQFLTLFQNQFRASSRSASSHVITWNSVERSLRARELIELEGDEVDRKIRCGLLDSDAHEKQNDYYSAISIRNRVVDSLAQEEFLKDVVAEHEQSLYTHQLPSIRAFKDEILWTIELLDAFEIWSTTALCSDVFRSPSTGGYNALHVPIKWPKVPLSGPDYFNQLGKNGFCPNALTYREFARLAVVAASHSLYSDLDLNTGTALTNSSLQNKESPKIQENKTMEKKSIFSDLIGLWLRSQRNPYAQRQLFQAFLIEKVNDTSCKEKLSDFRAQFLGKIPSRSSDKDIMIADSFIEKLISNAILIEYESALGTFRCVSSNKRKIESTLTSKALLKKPKVDTKREIDAEFVKALQNLFRWYSHRNASPILRHIFVDDIQLDDDKGIIDSKERSFSRIDTRIQQKRYACLDDLKAATLKLLDCYMTSISPLDVTAVREAIRDVHFLFRSDHLSYAKSLSLPTPWSGVCAKCTQSLKPSKQSVSFCGCCLQKYHSKCDERGRISSLSALSYSPLARIFSLESSSLPNEAIWGKVIKDLVRHESENDWGMNLEMTEEYCMSIDSLKSELWYPLCNESKVVPMIVSSVGLLVNKIRLGSSAYSAGIHEGDVITQVDVVENKMSSENLHQEITTLSFDLSTLPSKAERIDVFKRSHGRLRLHIERSTPNLLNCTKTWIEELHEKLALTVEVDTDNLCAPAWYCSYCCNFSKENSTIAHEASHCQAIIRRLGFQWCSIPFHHDMYSLDGSKIYCGLKRLYQMMDAIIVDKTQGSQESPFYIMLKNVEGENVYHRISWATKNLQDQPFKLLCAGMGEILNADILRNNPRLNLKRKTLGKEFLSMVKSIHMDVDNGLISYAPKKHIEVACFGTGEPWIDKKSTSSSSSSTIGVLETSKSSTVYDNIIDTMHLRKPLSFIGTALFFLCNDVRVMNFTSQKIQQSYIEYVVSTFSSKNESQLNDGIFCAIPIARMCDIQHLPLNVVEEVEGAIFLSWKDLLLCIEESRRIRQSVDKAVLQILLSGQASNVNENSQVSTIMSTFLDPISTNSVKSVDDKVNTKISEYTLLVDLLCSTQAYIVRDTLEDINKSRDGQRPSQQQTTIRPQQYAHCPELDTDIGESDDDPDDLYNSDEDATDSELDMHNESQPSLTIELPDEINHDRSGEVESQGETCNQNSSAITLKVGHLAHQGKVQDTYLKVHHLYSPGLPGSLLTWAETVLLIEAMFRNQPVLGIRLLCPRYDIPYIQNQYSAVIEPYIESNINECPRLEDDQWEAIIVADYQRSLHETGPIVFQEGDYSYRNPFQVLPLDRLLENQFATKSSTSNISTQVGPATSIKHLPQLQNIENLMSEVKPTTSFISQEVSTETNPVTSTSQSMEPNGTKSNDGGIVDLTEEEDAKSLSYTPNKNDLDKLNQNKLERIRGGSFREKSLPLAEFPVNLWTGIGVYGKCMTILEENTETEEGTFLGRIERVLLESKNCEVSIIYVMDSGYLPVPMLSTIPIDQLRVIQEDSDKNVLAQANNIVSIENSRVDATSVNIPESSAQVMPNAPTCYIPNYAKMKYGIYKSRNNISLKRSATLLVDRLNHRLSSCSPLGILPDGNVVSWFQSDPRAIYIRLRDISEVELLQSQVNLKASISKWSSQHSKEKILGSPLDESKLCCPWGCSTDNNAEDGAHRSLLSFISRKELDKHMQIFHINFCKPCHSELNWIRIPEGEGIRSLCADITAACCAANLDLSRVAIDFNTSASSVTPVGFSLSPFITRMIFKHNAVLDLTQAGRGSTHFSNLLFSLPNTDVSLRQQLRLWSRICRLFAIEKDGRFRLSISHCTTKIGRSVSSNVKTGEDGTDNTVEVVLLDDDIEEVGEDIIESIDADEETDEIYLSESENKEIYRKYDLISNSFGRPANKFIDSSISAMAASKDLLLRLALRIPSEIKLDKSFWDSTYFNRWVRYFEESNDEQMLYQALVLLQSSVNHSLLPKWFSRGWRSSYSMLSNVANLSSFVFRLYIFDSAVADYMQTMKDVSDTTVTDDESEQIAPKIANR